VVQVRPGSSRPARAGDLAPGGEVLAVRVLAGGVLAGGVLAVRVADHRPGGGTRLPASW